MVCTFHFNFNLYSTFHSTPGKVITWYASLTLSLTSIPPQGHLVQPHTLHIQNLWWEKRWLGVQDCGNHGREFELQVYLTVWVTLFSNGKNGATGWTFSPLQMESSGEKTLTDPSMAWLVNFRQNHNLNFFGSLLNLFLGWNVTKRWLWHWLGRPLHHPWQSQAAFLKTIPQELRMLSTLTVSH